MASPETTTSAHDLRGYDQIFWLAYLSNGFTTLANGMMVRYSDLVTQLGGDEGQLGWIVGVGMVGSILFRLLQGEAVDRYGASRIWMWCVVTYCVSLVLHLGLTTAYGPAMFVFRTLMQASLAGIFSSSITFVSLRVPPRRMAEVVGALGTSGFLGLMIGPLISDGIGRLADSPADMVRVMFQSATALAVCAAAATFFAVRTTLPPIRHVRPSLWKVIRQYHPVMISLTAMMMGAGFAIPATFLRPFAIEMNLQNIGMFFAVYAATGFGARLATRSLFERFGNKPWIATGLVLLTLSYVCYVPVTATWHLCLPAVLAGIAHALLFPSIMAAGTSVFPREYLGVATSFVLAMFDVGTLLSAPMVGTFLKLAKPRTDSSYAWMFAGVSVVFSFITAAYLVSLRRERTQQRIDARTR